MAIQLSRPDSHDMTTDSLAVQDVFTLFWFMLIIFFTYFLFYVMVFLIATACGLWYYNIDKNYLTTGLKNIFSAHLGSLTFASIIITIVTMIKQFLERKNQQNNNNCATCCTFMLCCLLCIIDTIEELIKVLNNNAVIIMSLTGEDYVDSAKTAIYVIMHNYQLFFVVDIICTLLSFCSFLFIAGLPALAGYFLLDSVNVDQNYKSNFVAFGVFIIIFIGFMVASLFMSVISESISSVFIFYCFDQRLQENNIPNNQVPNDMRNLFL